MKERHILIPHKPKEKKQAICTEALNKIKEKRKINENKPVRERLSLEDRANKLYDGRGDFGEFTADELAELWAGCMLSKENPYGKAYDDEIYDAIMDMGDVDSNISREIFDKADKIYDEKYHPLFEDTGDDIHEDVNDEKVIFVKQAEDYYDDADDYFDDEYLFSNDGDGLVITGNRHFKNYGDKTLIDAINDTYDEKEALDALKEITGVEYDKDEMHGYSQGDWQNIYYPVGTDQKILDEVENMYMGKYDVFTSENGEFVRVPHDISWNGADAIKEYISDEFGYSPDSIVLKKKVSRKVYDDEDFDESLKEGNYMDDFSKRWHEVFDKIQVGTKMKELSGSHAGKNFVVTKLYTDGGELRFLIRYDGEKTQYIAYADDIWDDYNRGKLKFLDESLNKSYLKNEVDPKDVEELKEEIEDIPNWFKSLYYEAKEKFPSGTQKDTSEQCKYIYDNTDMHDATLLKWRLAMQKEYYKDKDVTESKGKGMIDVLGDVKDKNESCDLKERGLTRAEKHNRAMDRIFDTYRKQNDALAKFLLDNGYSEDEVDELRKADKLNAEVYDKFGGSDGVAKALAIKVESCGKRKSNKKLTEGEELDRKGFVSLIRLGDHPYDGYSVLNDGYFVRRIYAESDDEAIDKFNQFLARKKRILR